MYTSKLIAAAIGAVVMLASPIPMAAEPIPIQKSILSYQQKAWLGALEFCESRGNPSAVNPKDRDNTPSYGLLQFKPSTFNYFSGMYGVATTSYMNPAEQEEIVTAMILHRDDIQWQKQFPDCVSHLGFPPKSATI